MLTTDDLIFYKDNGNIMSGGYKINSILLQSNLSENKNNIITDKLNENLAIPSGLFYFKNPFKNDGGKKYNQNKHEDEDKNENENEDDENEEDENEHENEEDENEHENEKIVKENIIDDDIYNKLLDMVKTDTFKLKSKQTKRKQRMTSKHKKQTKRNKMKR